MGRLTAPLTVRVYDGYALTTLIADLTDRLTRLEFTTRAHGGFGECHVTVPARPAEMLHAFRFGNQRGWHFYHVDIREGSDVVWEGRVVNPGITIGGGEVALTLECLGYFSSLRDQYYDASDSPIGSGNPGTDWSTGGPHTRDDVIKEMLTDVCPDINSDQSNIAANTLDIAGLDLTAAAYPQDIIVDTLAPLADSDETPWYFFVWESRIPYWKARSVSQVDYYVYLDALREGQFRQPGQDLRNAALTTLGATFSVTSDTASQAEYPARQLIVDAQTGVSATAKTQARAALLDERAFPKAQTGLTIEGQIYTSDAGPGAASGAMLECPKWRVRAGQVLRVQDLFPVSQASPALDQIRTMYIAETRYDAVADALTVQPEKQGLKLAAILARATNLERNK